MASHAACLTFDFDVVSSWIRRGATTPTQLSRGEFGLVGARRVLALLEREAIPSTWFIPGHTIESFPEECAAVVRAGHEVAHHGWLHEPPAELGSREAEADVLRRGIEDIERLTGRPPRGYRSPSWDLSEHTVGLLVELGFTYDSSLMGDDYTPYRCRTGDSAVADAPFVRGPQTELWELPISWTLDDHPHFEYVRRQGLLQPGLMNAGLVLENWVADARWMVDHLDRGIITITMHPQVVGRGHRMLMLEQLVARLRGMGLEFRTMEEALQEWP